MFIALVHSGVDAAAPTVSRNAALAEQLINAARCGDEANVRSLLARRCSVHHRIEVRLRIDSCVFALPFPWVSNIRMSQHVQAALQAAVENKHWSIANLLLHAGANPTLVGKVSAS